MPLNRPVLPFFLNLASVLSHPGDLPSPRSSLSAFLDKNIFIGNSAPVLALAAPGALWVSGLQITQPLSRKSESEGGDGCVLFKKSEKLDLPGGLQLFRRSCSEGWGMGVGLGITSLKPA